MSWSYAGSVKSSPIESTNLFSHLNRRFTHRGLRIVMVYTRRMRNRAMRRVPILESIPLESQKPKVIVVDDEPLIAETLAQILNLYGYEAVPAFSPSQAIEHVRSKPCDFLVTDVVMEGHMSGIELAIALAKILPNCKVLLMSGNVATNDLLKVANASGHAFEIVAKPAHPLDIIERLKRLT